MSAPQAGKVGLGLAWSGRSRFGASRRGKARQSRHGTFRRVVAWLGSAGVARRVSDGRVMARQARLGSARPGSVRLVSARPGSARPAMP